MWDPDHPEAARVLVTGSGGPLGVNVTRSLREASAPRFLVGTDANRYHLPLSLTDVTVLIPPAKAGEPYVDALNRIIERFHIDVVLPTHPVEVRAVSANRHRIGARVFLPDDEVIRAGDDKYASWQVWKAAGLPLPYTRLIESPADLERAFAEIGSTPVWVRGSGAPGLGIGVASLPCKSLGVAQAWVEHHQGWGGMAASEYLPGANLTHMSVWRDGELVTCASRERLAYVLPHVSPSGVTGAPAVTRTTHRADVREIGLAAVRAIDPRPHGAYFVDLKADAQDRPRITEVNVGRCGTTVHFYTRAGVNFPDLLVRLALGQAVPQYPVHDAAPADLYWVRTLDCGPALIEGEAGFDAYVRAGEEALS